MHIPLIIAILGVSFLIGYIAAKLWKKDSPQWGKFPGFYTFFPAVISILLSFVIQKRWSFGDFSYTKFDPFYLFLGFIIPVILYILSLAIQLRAGSLKLKPEIEWKKILPGIPVTILVLIIFVAGEEIGWRGFLQTPLINAFGAVGGVIILGLVWGIWHAPIALRGHNLTSDFWVETFVLYPFMCVCYSFPLAFLTIESGSIWPALIFHATNNTLGSIGTQIVDTQNTRRQVLFTLITGTILLIPFVLLLIN
jgi:membrane protease YdiL (CAAX protease family)